MSVPLGALVSKSRRMTLSSCSSVSMVEKSSSGMMFEGNTMRPCRLSTKAFIDGASLLGSARERELHPPLDGSDETRPELGGRDDVVHRPDTAGAYRVPG